MAKVGQWNWNQVQLDIISLDALFCGYVAFCGIYEYGQVWLYKVNVMIVNLILDWCYGFQYLIHCMHWGEV